MATPRLAWFLKHQASLRNSRFCVAEDLDISVCCVIGSTFKRTKAAVRSTEGAEWLPSGGNGSRLELLGRTGVETRTEARLCQSREVFAGTIIDVHGEKLRHVQVDPRTDRRSDNVFRLEIFLPLSTHAIIPDQDFLLVVFDLDLELPRTRFPPSDFTFA